MPRFYPASECNLFFENSQYLYHDRGREILRKNQLRNPISWYDDKTKRDPNRSTMCVWGMSENFKNQTGFEAEKFIKSRIRSDSKLLTAGQGGLWKITRTGCACMEKLPLDTWSLKNDWLRYSSFGKRRRNK